MGDQADGAALTDVVHQRTRLALLTVLHETGEADFTYLKSTLGLTDGNLGRHIEVLAAHGLVTMTKKPEGARPRTWVAITRPGRAALKAEVRALKSIVRRFEQAERIPSPDGNRPRPAAETPPR